MSQGLSCLFLAFFIFFPRIFDDFRLIFDSSSMVLRSLFVDVPRFSRGLSPVEGSL